MTQPINELSDRMRSIFGLVVEAYLERGQPVGSKVLAGTISLSPASIRGVMQELEERGLLTHPHTSAGRVPTESGLRLFVDGTCRVAARSATGGGDRGAMDRDQPTRGTGGGVVGLSGRRARVVCAETRRSITQLKFHVLTGGAGGGGPNRRGDEPGRDGRCGDGPAGATKKPEFRNARLRAMTSPRPKRGLRKGNSGSARSARQPGESLRRVGGVERGPCRARADCGAGQPTY